MKILAFPRDSNPYQTQLYAEITASGHSIEYLGEITSSHTANLFLLPFELVRQRIRGFSILHIHWLYSFQLPFAQSSQKMRRAMRIWLRVTLSTSRLLGLRTVWVAHNVLPHDQIFDDDVAARRMLLSRAHAVVTHSQQALEEIQALGPLPCLTAAARHPGYEIPLAPVRSGASSKADLQILFFGKILPYKGVADLINAVSRSSAGIELTVAGECRDSTLRAELQCLATAASGRVRLSFKRMSASELGEMIENCDIVALPFRRVTTTGSALYALSAGRPVILPDYPALREFPADATVRYTPTPDPVAGLVDVLGHLARQTSQLPVMGAAGREWAASYVWADLAQTVAAISEQCERL